MATDQAKPKGKKAKVASEQVASRKSSRISDQSAAKRKATEDESPSANKKRKPEEKPVLKAAGKKTKKVADKEEKKEKEEKVETVEKVEAPAPVKKTPTKKGQAKTKKAAAAKAVEKMDVDEEEKKEEEKMDVDEKDEKDEVAEEDDETTKALVEEIDGGDDEASGGASLFERGQDVGKVPSTATTSSKKKGAAKGKTAPAAAAAALATSISANGEPRGGVVYVGRIPHGFFEHEMRSYFSQFGDIRRLRLSRNRRTGASKHYAFIEFADPDVADIVAQTMDSYLLFGHILRCSVVPPERVPANLFVGANRRFKVVPWNRLAGRELAEPKSESAWEARSGREARRRSKRASLLQEKIGYAFEAPGLKKAVATIKAAGEDEEKESDEAATETAEIAAETAETVTETATEAEAVEAPKTELLTATEAEKEPEVVAAPKETKAAKAKKSRAKKSKA